MSVVQFKAVWPILGLIDSKLRQKIKMICVYGTDGNSVLILTNDDEVYSFGYDPDNYGFLGQGQGVTSLLQPKKIDVLSKKGIHILAFGSSGYALAATTNNEIYAWGYGSSGNLGNGGTAHVYVPEAITANFGGRRILRLACGSSHTLALTDGGGVFSWGTNNNGQLGHEQAATRPAPVTSSIGGKLVNDIACCSVSSYALLDNGELFAWGSNTYGQIGIGANGGQYAEPMLVTSLRNVVIKQIICGINHFLALSKSGHLYACGYNNYGQVGKGDTNNALNASQLPEKLGSFSQVAATHFSDLSAALSNTGEVYVWGRCRFMSITSPMKTELTSLDDAFACYATPAVTWRPLAIVSAVPKTYQGEVLASLKNCLHDDEVVTPDKFWLDQFISSCLSSNVCIHDIKDITFIIQNKKLRAHKTILMIRSEYFRKMFQNDWVERKKEGIYIENFTFEGFSAFIDYLYTGTMTDNLSFAVAVDLLQISDCYRELKLKGLCEEVLKDKIQITNCAYLYEIAIKFQAKLLRTGCAQFSAHHMTAVIASDYFKQMSNPKTIQDFLVTAAQYGAFKY